MDEADDLINEAIKQFNEKDYTEANELGKKAKNKIKKIKKKFIKKKALEMIKYAWKAIEEAEDNGEDTSEASKLLQDARDHVKLGNFEKAVSLAMQSIQLLKEE